MVNKTPGSATWDLAWRSHQLWTTLAQSLEEQGLDPTVELGWKKSGIITLSFYKFMFELQFERDSCQCSLSNLKFLI